MSDRWGVGLRLGSKLKSRKISRIDFFTSSRRDGCKDEFPFGFDPEKDFFPKYQSRLDE